ncbi:hypothetical protein OOK31_24995 [Streptomyces sp. NBC_00249]|uniref:hypothetical protein n=1 Tax=Streptomyces sp. NBC_00249 TaxID=2975690 RepID=UPI002254E02B|nr:hypothetical protein [Streptomyces sp. NBC_00249]MCX5197113.1 hypothetical protein [Streptomyces sp. NBC_00249]
MKRFVATTLICATAALGLSACSDDSSPAEEATKAAGALCNDLALLKADTAKLRALDPANATKDQIKEAYDAVQKDWENVKANRAALQEAKRDAVKGAADDLKKAYEDLPGDTTGKDAVTAITPQAQKLEQTVDAASTTLKC